VLGAKRDDFCGGRAAPESDVLLKFIDFREGEVIIRENPRINEHFEIIID
jgi:hypothetical protein